MDPDLLEKIFYLSQILMAALFLGAFLFRIPGLGKSKFKSKDKFKTQISLDLASAKISKKAPLLLEGVDIHATAHELLGVKQGATAEEINKAYKNKIKRYHPDKIGPQGEKIAEALNLAKEALLKKPGPV